LLLGFIIPFKPKHETIGWQSDNVLLQRTVECLLNQTAPGFKIYIIYTDRPEIDITDDRVSMHETVFPFLEFAAIPGNMEILKQHKVEKMIERRFDKGKKITYGSKLAKDDGCDYIMSVDADDLVSNRLLRYISENNAHNTVPGWYINKGYVFRNGRNRLLKNFNMHTYNGSTHILRADLVHIPSFDSTEWHDYSLFTAHGWIKNRVKKLYEAEILPVPFFAVIYVAHENNISHIHALVSARTVKDIVKRLLYSVRLTKKLQKEFSIR
jgi:hypothetical protein